MERKQGRGREGRDEDVVDDGGGTRTSCWGRDEDVVDDVVVVEMNVSKTSPSQ